jgi:hypothetical protein
MNNQIKCKKELPWHKASEEKPLDGSSVMLSSAENVFLILGKYSTDENRVANGNSMFFIYDSYKWAYLEDLMPNESC